MDIPEKQNFFPSEITQVTPTKPPMKEQNNNEKLKKSEGSSSKLQILQDLPRNKNGKKASDSVAGRKMNKNGGSTSQDQTITQINRKDDKQKNSTNQTKLYTKQQPYLPLNPYQQQHDSSSSSLKSHNMSTNSSENSKKSNEEIGQKKQITNDVRDIQILRRRRRKYLDGKSKDILSSRVDDKSKPNSRRKGFVTSQSTTSLSDTCNESQLEQDTSNIWIRPNFDQFKRGISRFEKNLFLRWPRNSSCLGRSFPSLVSEKNFPSTADITSKLADCTTMEHQIVKLRELLQQNKEDLICRYKMIVSLLDCISTHHEIYYEGILFGSSINGLGFRDSDVDLRLRPLRNTGPGMYEPILFSEDMTRLALRDISTQTCRCYRPTIGVFVPSSRCPIAKLKFYESKLDHENISKQNIYREAIQFDVSLSSENPLGSFNSCFLRFLCALEPKFHLLAMVIRYWFKQQDLIQAGLMSSYAIVNMLVLFCQTLCEPLLPSLEHMQHLFHSLQSQNSDIIVSKNLGITRIESLCSICMDTSQYQKSRNKEPLVVLLAKFFKYYSDFPYSSHIISIRGGRPVLLEDFISSDFYDSKFPINKDFMNIQDPFDLKHNLTGGSSAEYMVEYLYKIRKTFMLMSSELENNFKIPSEKQIWGLNRLFVKINVPSLESLNMLKHANQKQNQQKDIKTVDNQKKTIQKSTQE